MQYGYSLHQEQKQALRLSPEMRQSLEILRAGLPELREMLAQAICENPMLEMSSSPDAPFEIAVDFKDYYDPLFMFPEERPENAPPEPYMREIWETRLYNLQTGSSALWRPSFKEQALEQLNAMKLDADFLRTCQNVLESLDRRGYLTEDISSLAALFGESEFQVGQAVYVIQSLQPAGIGARSLQECLILQLAQSEYLNPYTMLMVNEGLGLLAAGDIHSLCKLLNASREVVLQTADIVKSLNPIPSQGYDTGEQTAYIIPDATVEKTNIGFEIIMNRGVLPKLELNKAYTELSEQAGTDESLRRFVKSHTGKAAVLIKSVSSRENTIVRILTKMIEMQPGFFEDGGILSPMLMSDVAQELGLNVSTVSRAVRDKYIVCAAGTVELSSLFSLPVTKNGGNAVSSEMIKADIRCFIKGEDPARPFSDEDIRSELLIKGIDISRRTVAKYRDAMGIESSSKRKRG